MNRLLIPGMTDRFSQFWFGKLDPRPIAAFRIGLAALLLKDALYHLPLAHLFYSDAGLVPRGLLLENLARDARFSLMDTLATAWMAQLFFLLWALVAVGLLLGWRTRWLAVLNFLIVLSVHERNVYFLTGADTVMRTFSFWLMCLPAGRAWALDARSNTPPEPVDAFPVRLLQVQIALIYLTAGALKFIGDHWLSGQAIDEVLQIETVLLPPGYLVRDLPPVVLNLMTRGVMVFENAFALLVFFPFGQPRWRALALMCGFLLHAGIAFTLAIPDFSLLMLCGYLVFFEPRWIVALADLFGRIPRLRPMLSAFWQRYARATPELSARPWRKRALYTVLALLMLCIIGWNISVIGQNSASETDIRLPLPVENLMWYSGLWQYWDLYAPLPRQVDGWMVVPGTFADGTQLNLVDGGPLTETRPELRFGPWMRWLKWGDNIFDYRYPALLERWANYYCELYSTTENPLISVQIIFWYRRVHAPDEPPNLMQLAVLWNQFCE